MNPCRCGHADDPGFACAKGPNARCAAQYQGRLSGPLIDRFDLLIDVPAVLAADLLRPAPAEGSAEVAERVAAAREIQRERFRELGVAGATCNAAAPAGAVESIAAMNDAARALLRDAAEKMRISARGFHRVLKLARTLADLEGADSVARVHLAEALSYRGRADRLSAAAA
jgi:magnesium chelatase family protein